MPFWVLGYIDIPEGRTKPKIMRGPFTTLHSASLAATKMRMNAFDAGPFSPAGPLELDPDTDGIKIVSVASEDEAFNTDYRKRGVWDWGMAKTGRKKPARKKPARKKPAKKPARKKAARKKPARKKPARKKTVKKSALSRKWSELKRRVKKVVGGR